MATMPRVTQIEQKNFHFELKSFDEDQGIIEGYLSTFDNVDSGNDRVIRGAFKKTLADAKSRMQFKGKKYLWPILWMHDPEKPLGGCLDAYEDAKGLYTKFQLDITRTEGQANNPLAVMVFSGYKNGYIDEQSMGYKVLQKEYDDQGIRNLRECQVWEESCVTSLFAMNDEAVVTSVKTATGSETFALADRKTPWSRSKAIKDIEAATGGDWSKASQYFFWSAPDPKTEADHKLPFVAMHGGEMKAIPQGIIGDAGAIRGARGGVKGIPEKDMPSIKAKIAGYYEKMGMPLPWESKSDESDGGDKCFMQNVEKKDFSNYYQARQVNAWLDKFYDLTSALRAAVMDCFGDGDQDSDISTDVEEVLNGDEDTPGFIHALLDWASEGQALGYTGTTNDPYGYMSRSDTLTGKVGAVVSAANTERIGGHVNTLMQVKDMIHSVAEDMQRYIGSPAFAEGIDIPVSGGKTTPDLPHTSRPPSAPALHTVTSSRASTEDGFGAAMVEWLATQK